MISPDRWQRLEPILDAALDLPDDEVAAYLDRACAGEPELRDEVEQFVAALRAHPDDVRFLDVPPAGLAARILTHSDRAEAATEDLLEGTTIGPYTVLRRLGGGGMGVVYLARDPRLDRLVALKVLPPWLVADEVATRRLSEEAKAASALDHPNIETVYDIGRVEDGRPYIAMGYYEGETLDERIRRGPLPVAEAVTLAVQLAEGLDAAHSRGIVHRDVKPANVIVTSDGVAKLVDFGLAKAADADLTQPGTTPGTVAYMSPEQTRGRSVDARTDLWSVGVLLYEMLSGRRPFPGRAPDAVIYSIRHDRPEPLARLRSEIPAWLARVVDRCLAKDVNSRYRDALSLAKALRHGAEASDAKRGRLRAVWIGTGLLIVLLLAGLWPGRWPAIASFGADGATAIPLSSRVAVLPLADSSPDPEDAYFADGLTQDLIEHLSAVRALRTTAFASVVALKGSEEGVAEIASRLGVGSLLLGSARKVAGRLHLSVRLVDDENRELWGEDYDTAIADVAPVRQDIVERVVATLGVPMRAPERRQVASVGTDVAEAYTEYLKGRYFMDAQDTWTARDHFERSLDLDPTFAEAWGGLARTYIQAAIRGLLEAGEAFPPARQAAEHALELNPDLAEVHAHLAGALNWYYWDTEGAEQHFLRALELDPSAAWVYRAYAVHLQNLGRFDEALQAEATVRELDPLGSAVAYEEEGTILYFARRYDEAMERFRRALRLDPTHTSVYFFIGLTYAETGRYAEALAALRQTDQPHTESIRGYVLALLGRTDEARGILDSLSGPLAKAVVHLGLGEYDRALDLLEQAAESRPWPLRLLKVEPAYDPVRDRPRFQALLRRMHLID